MYNYDRGGNITRTIQYTYTTGEPSEVLTDRTYAYDTVWKDKLITRGDRGLAYDAIGNLTQYSGWTYEWEAGRRLKRQTQENTVVTYEYDHSGMRVRKTVSGTDGTVRTVYDYAYCGEKLAHMSWGSNWMHFFYDAQGRPAKVRYNGTIYSYIHNLQGDIAGLLDGSGNVVVEYKYDAWGFLLSRTGSMAADLGKQNPFRYRGYIYDEETWMYWLKSRYYYPELQRFINADRYIGELAALMTWNTYAYCMNNSVNRMDSSGMRSVNVLSNMPVVHDIPRSEVTNKACVTKHAIDQLLDNVAPAMKERKRIKNANSNGFQSDMQVLMWFKDHVNHKAIWDYKAKGRTPEWLIGHDAQTVTIDGNEMTMEEFGNFNYGFVGYAIGIPRDVLIMGSIYAHYTSHGNLDDDPHDWEMINAGIDMAKRYQEKGIIGY